MAQTVAGVSYFKQVFNDANAGFNIPSLGLNIEVINASLYGSPNISINRFDEIGMTPPLGRIDTTGHIDQTFTYTAGNHQFRFGGEYRRARLDVFYERNKRGVFTFAGSQGPLAVTDPKDSWVQASRRSTRWPISCPAAWVRIKQLLPTGTCSGIIMSMALPSFCKTAGRYVLI